MVVERRILHGWVMLRQAAQFFSTGAIEAFEGGRVPAKPVVGKPNLKQEIPHLVCVKRIRRRRPKGFRGQGGRNGEREWRSRMLATLY